MTEELTVSLVVHMLCQVLGGLGLFLLGMKNMSEGIQAVAGSRLRQMIGAITSNRLKACGVGLIVTAIIQSSSITTVMAVSFVNAGIMTLKQAIGVIMGANIGTTATAWLIAGLPIKEFGLPILGISAFFFLFAKNEKLSYAGMSIMGIGMVFFGLDLMSSGMKPMRSVPEFQACFSAFQATNYPGVIKCVLTGAILTALVQSSSATIGLTMAMSLNGVISFDTAAALVLGENIGTTITAMLASIGGTTNGKRSAYSHMIFNVLGVIWITSIFFYYIRFIRNILPTAPETIVMKEGFKTFPHTASAIALVHSVFNIVNTLVFLPLLPIISTVVTKIVPDKGTEEVPHLSFLDVKLLDAPALGIQQSYDTIIKMGEHAMIMMNVLKEIFMSKEDADPQKVRRLFHREEILDNIQKEIFEFLTDLLAANVPHDIVQKGQVHFRIADEYEDIGDYIAALLKLHLKLRDEGIKFSDETLVELEKLHNAVAAYLTMVNTSIENNTPEVLTKKARVDGDAITRMMKTLRAKHLESISLKTIPPIKSYIFTDILSSYRKIKDHALNISDAFTGAL